MNDLFARVQPILATTPERWKALTSALSREQLTAAPAPGEWSALECLRHLVDTEHIFQTRLAAFRAGRDFPAFNPDEEGSKADRAPQELALVFAEMRSSSLRALADITPADYNLTARHSQLGPVTLGQMINEWAAHDLNHTVQAEEALMQPFIHGCGPWRVYFTAHIPTV